MTEGIWMMKRPNTKIMALAISSVLSLISPALAETISKPKDQPAMTKIQMIVGGDVLFATLEDTTAGQDFAAMLPLDLTLSDYHGIEKVADLPRKLDTSGAPASYKPETGDITLYAPWGNLAIFYKPFQASRGLVRLGEFDGPIDALIQDGSIRVRIEPVD
ncbi:cyclophilin-like fold protein [Roseovarius sp. MMSF_3281]|uniref:cyclophilin-like fold protein n=1 Tax=Roseovarius sp. MMSF_3281 TaxID=3046694 RepID=UPI00273DEBF1|nr:cyclophilin-like fold protein [Roseovarius sp. MMSF_3281]